MGFTFTRATPIYVGKDGGHARFRYSVTASPSPNQSPVVLGTISNAALVTACPRGDLNQIVRARDLGIGQIAAGTALTQLQAREILLCDVAGAAAGAERVWTNNNVKHAVIQHNVRGVAINGSPSLGTSNSHRTPLTVAVDVNVDASGRLVVEARGSFPFNGAGAAHSPYASASPLIGYIDLFFQHSLFRT